MHTLRLLLLLLACWLPTLPPQASASSAVPTTADFPHLQSCLENHGGRVLVRQNPWSKFDPEGLAAVTPEEAAQKYANAQRVIDGDYNSSNWIVRRFSDLFGIHNRFRQGVDAAYANARRTGDFSVPAGEQAKQITEQCLKQATITAAIVTAAASAADELTKPDLSPSNNPEDSQRKTNEKSKKTITRYMGRGEADEAKNTGNIPNYDEKGNPRPTHITTDKPIDSATEAKKKYELPSKPTHSATVPADRATNLGLAPDGRPQTSGGGSQKATPDLIPVKSDEIKELKK